MNGAASPSNLKQSAQQLVGELQQSLAALGEFDVHRERLGTSVSSQIAETVNDIRRRLGRSHVFVCIVGEQKAGKSTFLNAILGCELLGAAVRECTGTVTYIARGDRFRYCAQLRSGATEDFDTIYPHQEEVFAARVAQDQAQLQECDTNAVAFRREITRLETLLPEMNRALDDLKRQRAEADRFAGELAQEHARQLEAAQVFATELRAAESEIPAEYRQSGQWWSSVQRGVRIATSSTIKPEWRSHFENVKKLAAWERQVVELSRRSAAAAAAAEVARRNVTSHEQAILTETRRLDDARSSLAALPTVRAEREQQSRETREAWQRHQNERLARFTEDVKQLTDMNRRGHEVEELRLFVPSDRLPAGVVLIDTPGVNTAHDENRERAWRAIRAEADACILVSDISQTLSESTREFVRQVREVVPHILLVLTKLDAALRSATVSGGDAEREVAEAVHVGRARFAGETGRTEQEILACAVSARPALKEPGGPAAQTFDAELSRMFTVVEAERSIAVGAKCARAIQNVYRATRDTADAVERDYQQRIQSLLNQQIHDPRATCDQGICELVPDIRQLGHSVSAQLQAELHSLLTAFRTQVLERLNAANTADQLAREVAWFKDGVPAVLDGIGQQCRQRIDVAHGESIAHLIGKARQPLRERYRISKSLATIPPHPAEMPLRMFSPSSRVSLTGAATRIQTSVENYVGRNNYLAKVGTKAGVSALKANSTAGLVMAGVVLAATAAAGVVQAKKFASLKAQCLATIDEMLDQVIKESTCEAAIGPVATEHNIGLGLTDVVYRDISDFQLWIQGVIAQERQALVREQQLLAHLRGLRDKLSGHDARLRDLQDQATLICAGLSRASDGSRT